MAKLVASLHEFCFAYFQIGNIVARIECQCTQALVGEKGEQNVGCEEGNNNERMVGHEFVMF